MTKQIILYYSTSGGLLLYKYFYLSWSEQGDFSVCYGSHRCCKSHDDLHICPDHGPGRQKNSAHDWPRGHVYLLSSTSCLPFTTENIALAIIHKQLWLSSSTPVSLLLDQEQYLGSW
ncbi:solute carrier family 2, facilitated glucose transporter member 1 [Biomphalaria glabrata]|nr:solute carrier family 2, facilitated glucose transporter member 1 [Biomphalaria glabrata]